MQPTSLLRRSSSCPPYPSRKDTTFGPPPNSGRVIAPANLCSAVPSAISARQYCAGARPRAKRTMRAFSTSGGPAYRTACADESTHLIALFVKNLGPPFSPITLEGSKSLPYLAGDCKGSPHHLYRVGCGAHFRDLGCGTPPDLPPGAQPLRVVKGGRG